MGAYKIKVMGKIMSLIYKDIGALIFKKKKKDSGA